MERIVYDSTQKVIYSSTKKDPFFVEVPKMNYLTFVGSGHPAEDDYQLACEALYTLSYILKFKIARDRLEKDYKVNPMEVNWDLDKSKGKTKFTWKMMIMQPDFITAKMVDEAAEIAKESGKVIAFDRVKFETIDFGRCIQCFHLGDYNMMNDTLAKMHAFANENNLVSDQYTHDIYLNDMRKTKVENYKTIMRIKVYDTAQTV